MEMLEAILSPAESRVRATGPDDERAPTRSQLIDEALARRERREKELSMLRTTDPTAWCTVIISLCPSVLPGDAHSATVCPAIPAR